MSRLAFAVGLLALACGGESGEWSELQEPAGTGGQGAAGEVAVHGGTPAAAGSKAQPQGGSTAGGDTSAAGESATGGSGGEPVVSAGSNGMSGGAGGATSAGSGGQAIAGGGSGGAPMGGSAGKGQAGEPTGGAAGSPSYECSKPAPPEGCSVCSSNDALDCNGIPNDGLNKINPDSCEAWKGDHDSCGACGKKCGLSQVCKIGGVSGALTYYCQSP